jgi:catechol 2,3-dioxygenase-like lactoylglutathione lyase family enzyme
MATILHVSFRVRDPERSAELYAELLDGSLVDPGPQLRPIGVKSISFGRGVQNRLADLLEFWPQDKHWQGDFIPSDPCHHTPFGHLAFATAKSYDELAVIARKHGVEIRQEPRGPLGLTPVVYDYDGNFLEFFPGH